MSGTSGRVLPLSASPCSAVLCRVCPPRVTLHVTAHGGGFGGAEMELWSAVLTLISAEFHSIQWAQQRGPHINIIHDFYIKRGNGKGGTERKSRTVLR